MNRNRRNTSSLQILTIAAVCALFILTTFVGIHKCISRPPETADDQVSPSTDPGTDPETGLPNALPSDRKESFYTILIGGLDNENGGSDTNLLVALDAKNGTINVVSLPRDTLLNVSWTVKKLNNAYHHGGFSRTMEEVSGLLGIPVNFYVTVDLQAFVELVDAIGGVDFDIPVDMDYDDPYQDLHIHFEKGPRHLSGKEALQVVRWRQNNDGTGYATADIGRIGTQQAFLKAIAQQTLQLSNLDKVSSMAEIFAEHVDTNLKLSNLVWIGEQALRMGSGNITFHTLPGDGAGYYKGGSYYVLDDAATLELVNAYFNPHTYDLTLDDMNILVP